MRRLSTFIALLFIFIISNAQTNKWQHIKTAQISFEIPQDWKAANSIELYRDTIKTVKPYVYIDLTYYTYNLGDNDILVGKFRSSSKSKLSIDDVKQWAKRTFPQATISWGYDKTHSCYCGVQCNKEQIVANGKLKTIYATKLFKIRQKSAYIYIVSGFFPSYGLSSEERDPMLIKILNSIK